MNTRDLKNRLRDAAWTPHSPELRARILAEANVAPAAIAWTDRIWFSQTWRFCGFATAAVFLTLAVWPGSALPDSSSSTAGTTAITLAEDVARDAGFEPEQAAAFARRTSVVTHSHVSAPDLSLGGSLFEGGDR